MADLSGDIRLAVDSGEVVVGAKDVISSINTGTSKLIIMALRGKAELHADIVHLAKLAGIRIMKFHGDSVELGAVCGKPFSVSAVSIINPGDSKILDSSYTKLGKEIKESESQENKEFEEKNDKKE